MNLKQYYLKKVNVSTAVQRDSENLIEKMRNNDVDMDVLPNTYGDFTGQLEVDDYLSFSQFLDSRRGGLILELSEENV